MRTPVDFVDRSNYIARLKRMANKCVKCKGQNDTGYTLCEKCASEVKTCTECNKPMTDAQVKFSMDVYRKLLCWYDQPAQVRAREMEKGEKDAS